jgi:hypothetical protein
MNRFVRNFDIFYWIIVLKTDEYCITTYFILSEVFDFIKKIIRNNSNRNKLKFRKNEDFKTEKWL